MHLFPYLAFDKSETPLSFAARLAALHTGGRLTPFLNDLGISSLRLASGKKDAVEVLCDVAGVQHDFVIRNTPIWGDKALYNLRGEPITADFLSNPATVFCPQCLLDDDESGDEPAIARRGRLAWSLRVVWTCAVHGCHLVERTGRGWVSQCHELSVCVPERGSALYRLADQTPRRSVSPLQEYALARLDGAGGPAWLDSQTLEQAVWATEMLGALLEFGSGRKVSTLTADDWDIAGRVGFAATSRGEAGIRDALGEVHDAFARTGKRPMHRNVYGRLYESLAASKTARDHGDIKRILREHMLDTVELADGETLLGGVLPKRRLHSSASLSKETGLHPTTLRNVLIARGLISREGSNHVFDASIGRKVAASVRDMVHVIKLPKALNCSRPQASGLVDEQILLSIAYATSGIPGRTQKAIDARNVRDFLSALTAASRSVDVAPPGMVPISKAAEKAKACGVDIVHLILGGYLASVVRLSNVEGLASIHVDPGEVREKTEEVMFGLSPSSTAATLHLPIRTIWALLDECREGGPVIKSTIVHCPKGDHKFYRIPSSEVELFRDAYVTSAQVASALDLERRIVEKNLKSARVRPALSWGEVGVDLYLHRCLPELFLPAPRENAA